MIERVSLIQKFTNISPYFSLNSFINFCVIFNKIYRTMNNSKINIVHVEHDFTFKVHLQL